VRLAKYLAAAGVASRRKAEQIIQEGRVAVNGEIALLPQTEVTGAEEITVDKILIKGARQFYYLLLDKPRGVVTTAEDTHGRLTVLDLVRDIPARLFPVGRLDADTSGVLILTNDGDLAYRLTHPRFHVEKEYRVWVKGCPTKNELNKIADGIEIEGRKTAPAQVRAIQKKDKGALLELILTEGRKRQVKLMCAAIGCPVLSLRRTRFAFLTACGLQTGEYRHLRRTEVSKLYHLTGILAQSSETKKLAKNVNFKIK